MRSVYSSKCKRYIKTLQTFIYEMSINKNKTIMDNNINNMISISMPKGCRYMSDYENL